MTTLIIHGHIFFMCFSCAQLETESQELLCIAAVSRKCSHWSHPAYTNDFQRAFLCSSCPVCKWDISSQIIDTMYTSQVAIDANTPGNCSERASFQACRKWPTMDLCGETEPASRVSDIRHSMQVCNIACRFATGLRALEPVPPLGQPTSVA